MFADPQSVTITGVANSLPAISRQEGQSIYRKDDASVILTIARTFSKRNRYSVRLENTKTVTDPLLTATNIKVGMTAYLVIDVPTTGYSNTEAKEQALALSAWCTSANLLKVLGGET